MVKIASANVRHMQSTSDFPLTSAGRIRFVVGTKNGRYTIEVSEPEARKKGSTWYGLHAAGQQIIYDYRMMDKSRQK